MSATQFRRDVLVHCSVHTTAEIWRVYLLEELSVYFRRDVLTVDLARDRHISAAADVYYSAAHVSRWTSGVSHIHGSCQQILAGMSDIAQACPGATLKRYVS